jgi:hypothetical protein
MRLVLTIVVAGVVSAIAGLGAWYATSFWLPSWDDPAGRGLGEALRLFGVAVYALICMIVYGIASARGRRECAVRNALYALLLAPLLILVLGIVQSGVGRFDPVRDLVEAMQTFAPLWAVALVQWVVIRRVGSGEAAPA